ncbi:MAG: nucleotidyltransferase family protein [Armatimonadetes bacterium]|nr:nucleotidyltransferase family protein [Armatimonadota bacterium]
MDIKQLLESKREEILRIANEHGAHNIRIFGSVARGEASDTSDVDFLVEFEPGTSLLTHASLVVALEDLLGRKVDVAPEKTLKERIRARVISEALPL